MLSRLSIFWRLALGYVTILALVIGVNLYILNQFRALTELGAELATHHFPAVETAKQIAVDTGQDAISIVGGGEIYRQSMGIATVLHVTQVDASPQGDTVFPEIDFDKIDENWGMDIVIATTAKTDAEAKALLTAFNMPFSQ